MFEPPYRVKNMMPGMIMIWHGTRESIPSGWHECNGEMGTPDLRNRFVRGVYDPYEPGTLGGISSHQHDFTVDEHSHTIPEGTGLMAGTDYALETSLDPATGTTDLFLAYPPHIMLCYIMKL
ncbi:unnamed protein product [marine sediment metagenome]|uniref:Phage tail collar domain-containing protein n=1 Tax=marine sediment metagenome TaxID=412755 RepID=X1HU59_9ZZZZ